MVLGWGSKKKQDQKQSDDDMSMDEILASIRRYVSEETPATLPVDKKVTPQASPYRTGGGRVAAPALQSEKDNLVPKNSFEDSHLFSSHVSSAQPNLHGSTQEDPHKTTETTQSLMAAPPLSSNPFDRLAEAVCAHSPQKHSGAIEGRNQGPSQTMTLDQLVSDLAKPMVQHWISQNLPRIVEKMVADEIAKLTGHR